MNSFLNSEIRYRKVTILNIKEQNPLFRQRGITQDKKITNLRLLLKKTSLALANTATMTDLTKVIMQNENLAETEQSV